MAQYRYPDIHLSFFFDIFTDIYAAAYTLSNYYQGITTAVVVRSYQIVANLIQIKLTLRNQYNLSTTSNTCQSCQPATAAAHNLYYSNTAVSRSSITKLVDSVDNSIGSSIATDGVISTPYIIINGARQTNNRYTSLSTQLAGTSQAAVTTNDNQALNAIFLHVLISLHTSFWSCEALAASCTQKSTATLENIRYTTGAELLYMFIQKTTVSIVDTEYLTAFIQYSTNYGTCSCVHAWAIAATG